MTDFINFIHNFLYIIREEVGANPDRLDVIESIVKEGLDEKAYPRMPSVGCEGRHDYL